MPFLPCFLADGLGLGDAALPPLSENLLRDDLESDSGDAASAGDGDGGAAASEDDVPRPPVPAASIAAPLDAEASDATPGDLG